MERKKANGASRSDDSDALPSRRGELRFTDKEIEELNDILGHLRTVQLLIMKSKAFRDIYFRSKGPVRVLEHEISTTIEDLERALEEDA